MKKECENCGKRMAEKPCGCMKCKCGSIETGKCWELGH